ncbi:MAG: formylglycine-generating enzyme family protein [Myxococcota bacterium]|nr:formylglycine-generating enzyme family protein [Myxococcota bacterium]
MKSRLFLLSVPLALALVGCGSRADEPAPAPSPLPPAPKVWAGDLIDAAVPPEVPLEPDLIARLDALEPPYRAPPPTIRKYRQGDCKTRYAPRPARDPNPMCRVTGGTFMMGGPIPEDLAPAFSYVPVPVATTVGDFDIDQFEVTQQQAALFLNAHGNQCPGLDVRFAGDSPCLLVGLLPEEIHERDGRFVVPHGHELDAANGFSWEGAMRYCTWVGKRVPSSAQWEYAARHDPKTGRDLIYAWGDTWDSRRVSCAVIEECIQDKRRWVVGRFDGSKGRGDGTSPWGLHDTIGNLSETVFACADPEETCSPGTGRSCRCQAMSAVAGQADPAAMTAFARLGLYVPRTVDHGPKFATSGHGGLRCASTRP